jgi:hypothetical protein
LDVASEEYRPILSIEKRMRVEDLTVEDLDQAKGEDYRHLNLKEKCATVHSKPHQELLSYCYSAEEDTVVLMGNGNHEKVNTIGTVKIIDVDNQRKTQGSINLPDTMYIKNGHYHLFVVTKIMNSG